MSASEESNLIRPDQVDTPVVVKGQDPSFVRSVLESLPQITVPDLPPDAVGMSAEALAQVPTLTERAEAPKPELPETELSAQEPMQQEPVLGNDVPQRSMASPQGLPLDVESWVQQCQSRINQLADQIHKLNDRLDHIDHKPKA